MSGDEHPQTAGDRDRGRCVGGVPPRQALLASGELPLPKGGHVKVRDMGGWAQTSHLTCVPSVAQISTKEKVYLFDILLLGARAFKNGLSMILENKHILKVSNLTNVCYVAVTVGL